MTTLGQVIGFFALAVIARFAVIQQLSSLLARSRQIEADILALFGVVFLVSFSAEAVGLDVTLGALMIGLLVGEDERLSRLEVREGTPVSRTGCLFHFFSQAWERRSIFVS